MHAGRAGWVKLQGRSLGGDVGPLRHCLHVLLHALGTSVPPCNTSSAYMGMRAT